MTAENIAEHNPPSPRGVFVLLHGLGADGGDLLPLASEIGGGKWRVVCPNAPVRAVTINGGMRMRAWYDISSPDLAGRQDELGVLESAAAVEDILAAEKARGFAAGDIVLGGFSQGAAMALYCGLRHCERLAGIAAFSGYLLFAEKLRTDANAAARDVSVFQAQGDVDEIVLPEWARACRDELQNGGWNLEYREYPAAHNIHPQAIADMNRWLPGKNK